MKNTHLGAPMLALLVAAISLGSAYAQEPNLAAQAATESWLGLVDGQQYADSWQAAATFFKNAVTQQKWQEADKLVVGSVAEIRRRYG